MQEKREDPLLTYLRTYCRGKANRISGAKLSKIMGISISALQGRIQRLRRQGNPIASDAYGYYYAETPGEIFTTISRHQKLIRALEVDIRGLVTSMDKFKESPDPHSCDGGDGYC